MPPYDAYTVDPKNGAFTFTGPDGSITTAPTPASAMQARRIDSATAGADATAGAADPLRFGGAPDPAMAAAMAKGPDQRLAQNAPTAPAAYNPDAPPDNQYVAPEVAQQSQMQAEQVEWARQADEQKRRAGQPTADDYTPANAGVVPVAQAPASDFGVRGGTKPDIRKTTTMDMTGHSVPADGSMMSVAPPTDAGPQVAPTGGLFRAGAPQRPGESTDDYQSRLRDLDNIDVQRQKEAARGYGGGPVVKHPAEYQHAHRQTTTAGLQRPETTQDVLMGGMVSQDADLNLQRVTDQQASINAGIRADENERYARGREEEAAIGRLQAAAIKDQQRAKFEEIQSAKVDPNRYWANKDTGQKIGAALAIMLGAVGASLQGKDTNHALEIIRGAQRADVDQQIADIDKKKGEYSLIQQSYVDTLAETGSKLAANAAAHETSLAVIDQTAARVALSSGSPIAEAKYQQMQAHFQKQAAEYRAEQERAAYGTRAESDQWKPAYQTGGSGGANWEKQRAIAAQRVGTAKEMALGPAGTQGLGQKAPRTFIAGGKMYLAAPGSTDEQINKAVDKINAAETMEQIRKSEEKDGPGVLRRVASAVIPFVDIPADTETNADALASAASVAGGSGVPSEIQARMAKRNMGGVFSREPSMAAHKKNSQIYKDQAIQSVGATLVGDAPIRPGGK